MLTSRVAPASASSEAGGPGLPDVLADGQADAQVAELDQPAAVARLEVALLVEDAVVGQEHLAVDRLYAAAGEHGAGVVDVVGELWEADQRHDPVGRGGDPLERRARVGEEVLLEQQVLGRIAGHRELGEQDQLRRPLRRASCRLATIRRSLPAMSPTVMSSWQSAI